MNILICHERFVFRFGADRVFILLAQGLRELGHHVVMMAHRYDENVVLSVASEMIQVPSDCGDYSLLDEFTVDWLQKNWDDRFHSGNRPEVVIVGGWPFFSSIPFYREHGCAVIFVDTGVVPAKGYSAAVQRVLERLRGLRRKFLRDASTIVGISDFIVNTQSRADSRGQVPARTVLLGANHLEKPIWVAQHLKASSTHGRAAELVHSLKKQGWSLILALGRWEPGCYKNSDAALRILRSLRAAVPDAVLLILADAKEVDVSPELAEFVQPLGFPDDSELVEIMRRADMGISVSLWEGFNLPLAEMQWLDRPCLAFDVGAHPEVILHPWYLCRDEKEMAEKAIAILNGSGSGSAVRTPALRKFRERFTWTRAVEEYAGVFDELLQPKGPRNLSEGVSLIIDVTNATRDPANSGVIRVTRRASRTLQEYEDPLFVVWDATEKHYVLPTRQEFDQLSKFNGPVLQGENRLSAAHDHRTDLDDALVRFGTDHPCLLLPELRSEEEYQEIRRYADVRTLGVAAIFYDAIAVLHPNLCNKEIQRNHGAYMRGLAECDVVVPISNFSANCLTEYWEACDVDDPARVTVAVLPGEFGSERKLNPLTPSKGAVEILCVSTLEPRKNHRVLIEACRLLRERKCPLDWRLNLVGNRYAGAPEIAEYVERQARSDTRIRWLGVVDDNTLQELYESCHFTVYPSLIEGFGMPILESLWHARPCICSQEGVMAELAEDGGCLTTDVRDSKALADSIYRLATDAELYQRLAREAVGLRIKTWAEYAQELRDALQAARRPSHRGRSVLSSRHNGAWPEWRETVYPPCQLDKWQMNDSERLAVTALLARQRPHCSVEAGSFSRGSSALLAQYSTAVISVNIEPEVPSKPGPFPNVSLVNGQPADVLPLLFEELDRCGLSVDLLLLDAEHSRDAVRRDVRPVLDYVPSEPLIVLVHDSFHPDCRGGLLDAGWSDSPYCHWVDLDFVPGRIVEHEGPHHGQLWGGLAMAYFRPERRKDDLRIHTSAALMFESLKEISERLKRTVTI